MPVLQQALIALYGSTDLRWLGQSSEFQDAWRPLVESVIRGFGTRPPDGRCPASVFALPLSKRLVVVCQTADLGGTDSRPPVALGFHVLVLSEADYWSAGGDPFALAAACPPNWDARGGLPVLNYTTPSTRRTVEQVCEVLKRPDGPTLLGATQALVDGGRVAWVKPEPQTEMLRALWTLLPTRTCSRLWPASFAFSNALQFDVVVVPQIAKGEFDRRYLSEEQAENYPEGRYELAVQTAAEAGDQVGLDHLFSRRSRGDVWRLGLWLLAALVLLTVAMNLLKVLGK